MMFRFYFIYAVLFLGNAAAQDYIDPDWISTEKRTIRSVHVNSADLENQTHWCSYTIDKYIDEFMDDDQRNEHRAVEWLTVGDRTSSCLWMVNCQRGWDKMEGILEGALQASKTLQYENLQKEKQRIEEYNKQALKDGQPLKKVPQNAPQLRGDTDGQFDFVHISILQLKIFLKHDCMMNQLAKKIEITIDKDLLKENKKQDESYISAKQYALGFFNNIHYRFVEMQQNHILISWFDSIYEGNYVYDIRSKNLSRQP